MKAVPLELSELNELVSKWHRHHKPVQGHRFSVGVEDKGEIHGGASVGRPVARLGGNPKEVLEVTRLVTDGKKNACSFLYAACARIGKEMGYKRIQTYILDSETGTSLLAAGWTFEGVFGGGSWTRKNRERREDQPKGMKGKYFKNLREIL
ncbi:MAG: hypothetical protein KGL39_31965 [Patescibacteria group bacterium]|nr:hypothetical protein [Patescibacteria group bacterium]